MADVNAVGRTGTGMHLRTSGPTQQKQICRGQEMTNRLSLHLFLNCTKKTASHIKREIKSL